MTQMDYERALARLPHWMLGLAVIGTAIAFRKAGVQGGAGFLLGAIAAWFNLKLLERAVDGILRKMSSEPGTVKASSGVRIFIEFAVFAGIAFVILRFTGFNLMAAVLGFLVCPVAVLVEIVYELFNVSH